MTVTEFRKKPVTITAVQWTGTNLAEVQAFTGADYFQEAKGLSSGFGDAAITAQVLDVLHDTWVGVKTGQWVIKGVRGELYPIDEGVLADTYDRLPAAGS